VQTQVKRAPYFRKQAAYSRQTDAANKQMLKTNRCFARKRDVSTRIIAGVQTAMKRAPCPRITAAYSHKRDVSLRKYIHVYETSLLWEHEKRAPCPRITAAYPHRRDVSLRKALYQHVIVKKALHQRVIVKRALYQHKKEAYEPTIEIVLVWTRVRKKRPRNKEGASR